MSTDVAPTYTPKSIVVDMGRQKEEVVRPPEKADLTSSKVIAEERRAQLVAAISKADNIPAGRLVIEKDSESNKYIHKIVDPVSGEIIRQWPDDAFLQRLKELESTAGLWLDKTV